MNNLDITKEELIEIKSLIEKKNIDNEQLEKLIFNLILCKIYDNKINKISLQSESFNELGERLLSFLNKLGIDNSIFNKKEEEKTYDFLKMHLIVTTLTNNYGSLNEKYDMINLNIPEHIINKNKREYKNINKIIEKGYRYILNLEEENINCIDNKNISELELLIDNIDMMNLITNPNEIDVINYKEFFELFIDYQRYYKQKIKEIFYNEHLENSYTDIEITRYTEDKNGVSLVIQFEENYGELIKSSLFAKEKILESIKYIWDRSKIIRCEKTLDNLFDFVEKNKTYLNSKKIYTIEEKNEFFQMFFHNKNEYKYENLALTYNDGQNIINIRSNYLDNEITYELYINGITINIMNEDMEPILENLYINIEFLPQYLQDYIQIKEKKNKRKKRWINK